MAVLDLSAYKPVPATLGDANQIANGFQAIQNCINALDNNNFAAGRIFDPAKLMQNAAIDGDPLVWDNTLTKWVPASTLAAGRPRAPRVFTSTMAGGPPASPVDQDIWVATAVDANGTRWAFQYNAGSGSAFKWECIGGGWLFVELSVGLAISALTAIGATGWSYHNATGSKLTLPRAGDYAFRASSWMSANGVSGQASLAVGNVTQVVGAVGISRRDIHLDTTVTPNSVSVDSKLTAAVNDVVAPVYSSSATGNLVNQHGFTIQPVRVS